MKKNKKALIIVLLVITLAVAFLILNPKEKGKKEDPPFISTGKSIEEVEKYYKEKSLNLEKEYVYSKEIEENIIISEEKDGLTTKVIVSKGRVPLSVYQDNNVNELGKIPIMMYHGIVNTTSNKYTGGNVDKDGYNRTSDAFRSDLESYYQKGYRMVRLIDYVNGEISTELGKSPLILTFDDGREDNLKVTGIDESGNIIIDPNSAVGILEEYKTKYKDFNVTATFFLNSGLFQQKEYNEKILKWLVENNYDIGNHTTNHADFKTISSTKTQEVVGRMYEILDGIIPNQYVKIIALPFGSPYSKSHSNFNFILNGTYNDKTYETTSALRVGWEPEVSPFSTSFDKTFLKRCRAYDNNGKEFDLQMVFKMLEKSRYISDGDKDTIVIKQGSTTNATTKEVIEY